MTAVGELLVRSPVEPWEAIGLHIEHHVSYVAGIRLRFVDGAGVTGMIGWTLVASPGKLPEIDGLLTTHDDEFQPGAWEHPGGMTAIDHLVVNTSSLERTCGALERVTGEPLKRVRDTGHIRQGFHRLGSLIVEVVESARTAHEHATFWGFVLVVADLDEVVERLGPAVIRPPRAAVQPGRSIASFRREAGLGMPVALMSPQLR